MSWTEPKPLSDKLLAISDAPQSELELMMRTAYTTMNSSSAPFRKGMAEFGDSPELTVAGLYAYTRSIGTFYNNVGELDITVGEIAFVASREPYSEKGLDDYRQYSDTGEVVRGDMTKCLPVFRNFPEPYVALAFFVLLYPQVPSSDFAAFSTISFIDAARYLSAGITNPSTIKAMMEQCIDPELAASAVGV